MDWPARSPDLTPLDFFLWGYVKQRVYVNPVANSDLLKVRIRQVCSEIDPEMIDRVCRIDMRRRHQLCREQNGHQFEHLIT